MAQIFLNYRRDDTKAASHLLFQRLVTEFKPENVFRDLSKIAPGELFENEINRTLNSTKVFLALIGDYWLDASDDASGLRRLDDANDFVRAEIRGALIRGVKIIPILVDEAEMPREDDLPEDVKGLAKFHAVKLRHDGDYESDVGKIIEAIRQNIDEAKPAPQAGSRPIDFPPQPSQKRKEVYALDQKTLAGNLDAMIDLGDAYLKGSLGAQQDANIALQWYEAARRRGHPKSLRKSAEIFLTGPKALRNVEEGLARLNTAAEQGDHECHAQLGKIYLEGKILPPDYSLAKQHLEKADAENIASAAVNLARIYEQGLVPPENKAKALELIKKADALGHAWAMLRVALMYYQGDGVPKNMPLAKLKFEGAAEKGQLQAHYCLGEIYENGFGCEIDYGNARHHYDAAAKHRYPLGMYKLARMCDRGRGGPRDAVKAAELVLNWLKGTTAEDCNQALDSGLSDWSSDLRAELQKNLAKRNVHKGPHTGLIDDETRKAIDKFIGKRPPG